MSTNDLICFQQLEQYFRLGSKLPDMHMQSKTLSKLTLMELLFIITCHKGAHHCSTINCHGVNKGEEPCKKGIQTVKHNTISY